MRKLKALTKEGQDRKENRLVVKLLKEEDRDLYDKLVKQARKTIKKDNRSPLTPVMTNGLDTVHVSSDYIKAQRDLAKKIRDKFLSRQQT